MYMKHLRFLQIGNFFYLFPFSPFNEKNIGNQFHMKFLEKIYIFNSGKIYRKKIIFEKRIPKWDFIGKKHVFFSIFRKILIEILIRKYTFKMGFNLSFH